MRRLLYISIVSSILFINLVDCNSSCCAYPAARFRLAAVITESNSLDKNKQHYLSGIHT